MNNQAMLCLGVNVPDQPAIELWNFSTPHAPPDLTPEPHANSTKQMKAHAPEQWDNEGGMTPDEHLTQHMTPANYSR